MLDWMAELNSCKVVVSGNEKYVWNIEYHEAESCFCQEWYEANVISSNPAIKQAVDRLRRDFYSFLDAACDWTSHQRLLMVTHSGIMQTLYSFVIGVSPVDICCNYDILFDGFLKFELSKVNGCYRFYCIEIDT